MAGTVEQTLDIARACIGETEKPSRSNKTRFGAWFGMNGVPWCAQWLSWVLDQVGITEFRHAYTPTQADLFRRRGLWHTSTPRPGDVAFFDFPDSKRRIQHVGFVESVQANGSIQSIEGNTSRGDGGSQDNGGGVYRRKRAPSLIVGYGRPPYADADVRPGRPEQADYYFGPGDAGADVNVWQRQLNAIDAAGLTVDGDFGKRTEAATRAFQARRGLPVTGYVDAATVAAMEQAYRDARPPEPPTPDFDVAVRYSAGKVVDERIGRALAALLHVNVASHEDARLVRQVYLIGGDAVRGYDRALAREVVEVAGGDRHETWGKVSQVAAGVLRRL